MRKKEQIKQLEKQVANLQLEIEYREKLLESMHETNGELLQQRDDALRELAAKEVAKKAPAKRGRKPKSDDSAAKD